MIDERWVIIFSVFTGHERKKRSNNLPYGEINELLEVVKESLPPGITSITSS